MPNELTDVQHQHRVSRGPAWRFEFIQQALRGNDRALEQLDAVGRGVVDCLRSSPAGHDGAANLAYCEAVAALELWKRAPQREQLQVLVIGGCDSTEVADTLAFSTRVIEIAESLFFDVRALLWNSAWIKANVIEPTEKARAYDLAGKLRVAYVGGRSAARQMVTIGGALPVDGADLLFSRDVLLHAKFEACLAAPLGKPKDRERFARRCMDYFERTRKLQFDIEKFRERCEKSRRAHELALLRARGSRNSRKRPKADSQGTQSCSSPDTSAPATV